MLTYLSLKTTSTLPFTTNTHLKTPTYKNSQSVLQSSIEEETHKPNY